MTEVLPISSSAHLEICGEILKIEDNSQTFKVFLHLASLIATVFFLRKRLFKLIRGFFLYLFKKDKESRYEYFYCWLIVLSMIPSIIFALMFKDYIESVNNNLLIIGLFLVINGISLSLFSKIKVRINQNINYKDALIIGGFQCLGLFSGISRSGSCLNGARLRGLSKENVADFVFIMLIPAVLGASVIELKDLDVFYIDKYQIILYLISFLVTLLVTYLSFKLLLVIIRKSKFIYFSIYCEIIGLFIILYEVI